MFSTANLLYIYLQNVCKNYALVDSLLEKQKNQYNILLIQEPLQNFICFILFTTTPREDEVVDTPIYLNQTQVVQFLQNSKQIPRVIYFIQFRLSRLCFSLRRDIVDYRDIQLLFFFNREKCQFLMNIYFDSLYTIDFLSNKALNISNLLYIRGDFNIRYTEQDLLSEQKIIDFIYF